MKPRITKHTPWEERIEKKLDRLIQRKNYSSFYKNTRRHQLKDQLIFDLKKKIQQLEVEKLALLQHNKELNAFLEKTIKEPL